MRSKFMISRRDAGEQLNIREYAVTEPDPKKVLVSMLEKSKFTFLGQETYAGEAVRQAIRGGLATLVTRLRTNNLFPIAAYITPIAEAVITLYEAPGEGDTELFFDDADLIPPLEDEAAT
jgi:hypothetical protein